MDSWVVFTFVSDDTGIMNLCVQIFMWISVFSWIVGSCGNSVFNSLWNYQAVFAVSVPFYIIITVGGFQFIYNFVNYGYCPAFFFFFFLILTKVKVLMAQSTLCNPRNCSLPGSSVHGILQARILEWVAIPFSWGSFNPRIEPRSPAFQADDLPLSHQGISVGVKWYLRVLIWIPLMTDVLSIF